MGRRWFLIVAWSGLVLPLSLIGKDLSPSRSLLAEASPPAAVQEMELDSAEEIAALAQEEKEVAAELQSSPTVIDLRQVFAGSPTIYSILLLLSLVTVGVGTYTLLSVRSRELFPRGPHETLKYQLEGRQYQLAYETCQRHPSLLFTMVASALEHRQSGSTEMLQRMQTEGKRHTVLLWQKIALLNDIAILAPMIGLLGTVLGMFYAFYDLNRSMESISALFDGLGISVGTTVGGLLVAILALFFHTLTKYRLLRQLSRVEQEAYVLVRSVEPTQQPGDLP